MSFPSGRPLCRRGARAALRSSACTGRRVTGPSLGAVGRKPAWTEAGCMPAAGPHSSRQSLQRGTGHNRPASRRCRRPFQVETEARRGRDTCPRDARTRPRAGQAPAPREPCSSRCSDPHKDCRICHLLPGLYEDVCNGCIVESKSEAFVKAESP